MGTDSKTNVFTIVLSAIFVVGIVVGVILFANTKPSTTNDAGISGKVVVWGTLDDRLFQEAAGRTAEQTSQLSGVQVIYKEFSPEVFEFELLDALAAGTGPDLIVMNDGDVVRQSKRLLTVPFESYPPKDFMQTYIESANVFLFRNQVIGFPLFVDPMIMYYNKDILASQFMIYPPTTWIDMVNTAPTLTKKSDSGIVEKSAIAMGTYQNIPHANDIFALLSLQQGNPFVVMNDQGKFISIMNENGLGQQEFPVGKSLQLFASFADLAQPHYTWNASLPSAQDMFAAGDLAFYIGYASEYRAIISKNPNLNFGVSIMPQVAEDATKVTLGKVYALGALKSSKNPATAFATMNAFSSDAGNALFAETFAASPVRKTLLSKKMNDPVMEVFQNSSIIARTWLNPDAARVVTIFKNLIIDFNAGRDDTDALIRTASDEIQDLLDKHINNDIDRETAEATAQ